MALPDTNAGHTGITFTDSARSLVAEILDGHILWKKVFKRNVFIVNDKRKG